MYQAFARVNGVDLSPGYDGTAIVALDEMSIEWGRNDIYRDPEPATLQLDVIDPIGYFATDNDLQGAEVLAGRLDPERVMFRGQITDVRPTLITIAHPETGQKVRVWRVRITAKDKLAALAQARPIGPQAYAVLPSPQADLQAGWWLQKNGGPRLTDVMNQGANDIVASIDVPNIVTELGLVAPASTDTLHFTFHLVGERKSLHELIAEVYHGSVPLGHVNYDAHTNTIQVGRTAGDAGTQLYLDGSVVRIRPVAGKIIDAAKVVTEKDPSLTSSVAAGIDIVQVPFNASSSVWAVGVSQGLTARGVSSSTARTLTIETLFHKNPSGTGSYGEIIAAALVAKVIDLVDDINGKFFGPPVSFDFRRFTTGDSTIDDILLDTKDRPTALYFLGSELNNLPNYGPQFQLIGGRARWLGQSPGSELPAGWVVDMTLAPATGIASPVGILALITNTTPSITDIDPLISIGELGTVTIGLA